MDEVRLTADDHPGETVTRDEAVCAIKARFDNQAPLTGHSGAPISVSVCKCPKVKHPRQQRRGCSIKVDCKPSSVPCDAGVYGLGRPSSSPRSKAAAIHLGPPLPEGSSGQPGGWSGCVIAPLFGLAPGGVCPAPGVTVRAVSSYLAISPLSG